jgi:hypothetical protein
LSNASTTAACIWRDMVFPLSGLVSVADAEP